MSCSNQIICYTSPHLSLHVPFFFLLIILTHCYVIVYSFYYPPLQAYLQYKKSLSNIIHLSHRQIQILACFQLFTKLKFVSLASVKSMLYAKRNFFEYFFHLYNNFFFKHKLPPFIPYRCFSSIYPFFCWPIQSASWDGAFHPASPEYPSCFPAAAAPQSDLL